MIQCLNIHEYNQQEFTNIAVCEQTVKLIIPACYQGRPVTTSIIMMELLWQQYGLDTIHPEVSRWLEQNAPDVKNAAADNQFAYSDDCAQIEVEPNGTIELHLPLELNDRLREVSTQY